VRNLRNSESTYFLDFQPSDAYTLSDIWNLEASIFIVFFRKLQVILVKNPGSKDQALVYPWKRLFFLKSNKLKVP